jgi:transcriptional regulator with XRE-family HTH domain
MGRTLFSPAYAGIVAALIRARKASGLLQTDLAAKLGKDQSYISNIERGQRRVDVLELYAIARALGRDPVELYGDLIHDLPPHVDI